MTTNSRGTILGRLVVARRGTPRKTTRSGSCVECSKMIKKGEIHFVLLRSWKPKGKVLWYTRRYHQPCFLIWLLDADKWVAANEKKAAAGRTGRPVSLSGLSEEHKVERLKMIKRRSYLMNRLMRNPQYDEETFQEIMSEVQELAGKVDALAPSHRFATKKREQRYREYLTELSNRNIIHISPPASYNV